MIYLGLTRAERAEEIRRYMGEHGIRKVFVLSPARFSLPGWDREMTEPETECDGRPGLFVDWPHVIFYRWYYRLLQVIDQDTLLVVNEGLRTQNRHDLSYNCVRQYLQQTRHVLVFSTLPMIDTMDDFMVLVDWVTRSRWKREPFAPAMLAEVVVRGRAIVPEFVPVFVPVTPKIHTAYAVTKERLLAEIRDDVDKDPHQLPRQLHLVAGPAKVSQVALGLPAIGRNNRFKLPGMETYRTVAEEGERTVFEWPHNFLDYADALAVTRAPRARVLLADTKADRWYLDRFNAWAGRLADAAAALHG